MNPYHAIAKLHSLFRDTSTNQPRWVPLLKPPGEGFNAWLDPQNRGICVAGLGNSPLLHWAAFGEAVRLLCTSADGCAKRGSGMAGRLGANGCPLDSIEGHVAQAVYGKQPGDAVFRRVSPIAAILIAAGICRQKQGRLCLQTLCDPTPGGFGCAQLTNP